MMNSMQQNASATPRQRQEIEPPRLLKTRREIPLVLAQTTFTTLLTARADAYFLVENLWMANVTAGAITVQVCLVAPAGLPTSANAVAWTVAIAANTSALIVGASGLLIPPGYTLQGQCSTNNAVNFFGWGWNIIGDSQ